MSLPPENDMGNEEYKWKLVDLTEQQLNHRVTQLQYRLNEGNGEAIYRIGYLDNGEAKGITEEEMYESIETMRKVVASLSSCSMEVIEIKDGTATIYIKQMKNSCKIPTSRIAIAGNVSSGKSTLLAVISKGVKDDGKGAARNQIFQHNHEFRSGHTSSITVHNMHFDKKGSVLNLKDDNETTSSDIKRFVPTNVHLSCRNNSNNSSSSSSSSSGSNTLGSVGTNQNSSAITNDTVLPIMNHPVASVIRRNRSYSDIELTDEEVTYRVVSLIDLAGHEKYLKTTLHGLVGMKPDFCMLTISAVQNSDNSMDMTGEHLGIISAITLPFFITITKVDGVLNEEFSSIERSITSLVTNTLQRRAIILNKLTDVMENEFDLTKTVPIIATSSVMGVGIDVLRALLFKLASSKQHTETPIMHDSNETEIRVMDFYSFVPNELEVEPSPDPPIEGCKWKGTCHNNGIRSKKKKDGDKIVDVFSRQHQMNREYIILGFVECGSVSVGQKLLLGPTPSGEFIPIETRSIHVNKVSVNQANTDQNATIGIKFDRDLNDEFIASGQTGEGAYISKPPNSNSCHRSDVNIYNPTTVSTDCGTTNRNSSPPEESSSSCVRHLLGRKRGSGLVALPTNLNCIENTVCTTQGACYEFNAQIMILNHPSFVGVDYEPVVHALCVRQSAKIMSITLSGNLHELIYSQIDILFSYFPQLFLLTAINDFLLFIYVLTSMHQCCTY